MIFIIYGPCKSWHQKTLLGIVINGCMTVYFIIFVFYFNCTACTSDTNRNSNQPLLAQCL